MRIANNAAFRASEWNVYNCALPCHPRSKRFHFIERDSRMIANTAFTRPASGVVLHAVSFKNANRAVIHFYRQSNGELTPRTTQHLTQPGFEVATFHSGIELPLRDAKRVQIFFGFGFDWNGQMSNCHRHLLSREHTHPFRKREEFLASSRRVV